jgi:hypothetical protein
MMLFGLFSDLCGDGCFLEMGFLGGDSCGLLISGAKKGLLRTALVIKVFLGLGLSLGVSLSVLGLGNLLLVARLAQDAITLIHEPGVANASLVVIAVIQGVSGGESDQIARIGLYALGEVLSMGGRTLLGEGAHLRATKMVLRVQVEEIEKIQVDLSSVVSGVRLSAELHIALFVAIEHVGGSSESRENLAQLVVLVGLVEAGGNLMHGWHGATGSHVDPECREESKDATLKVLGVHHNVHLVLGVAGVDSVGEAAVIVVPLHHKRATGIVLSMLVWRPRFGGPAVRVEVALGGAVEWRVLGVLSTMVVLDVLETLSEVLVVVRLTSVCFEDNVREQSSEFALANLSFGQTESGVVLTTELGEEASRNDEGLVGVELVVEGEQMFEILLAKDLHDHANVLFVIILDSRATVQGCRRDSSFSLRLETIGHSVFDTNSLILIEPVVAGPNAVLEGKS